MITYPPSPFQRNGVTTVQPLRGFHVYVVSHPWGGPVGS